MSDIYTNGYDMVHEIARYDHVKARLCTEQRKCLGTEYNPDHGSKTVFFGGSSASGKYLQLSSNRSH